MYAESNWRLLCARYDDHVEILQAVTCDTVATLPTTLWDLPVTMLGNHALRQGWGAPAQGEPLTLTCGTPDPQTHWDNRNLQALTLPPTLTHVGDFALCNCQGLTTLTLWDDVVDWGSCALMNCRQLTQFHLQRTQQTQGRSLAYFARELTWDLDVTITETNGDVARLLFPEFEERFEENHLTLRFSYSLAGGGYLYHHVFTDKQISLRVYDSLFPKFLAKGHDPHTAMMLAYHRLRHPTGLSEQSAQKYWDYLMSHPLETLTWLVSQRDAPGLHLVLPQLSHCQDTLTAASAQCREANFTQGSALFLEHLHRGGVQAPTFDFDF